MNDLDTVAPAFVAIAHRIVWTTVATVTPEGRPRTRILRPLWEWDGASLVGWIATSPSSPKRADLDATPRVSLTYWDDTQDTATADCETTWVLDDDGRRQVWETFARGPEPAGATTRRSCRRGPSRSPMPSGACASTRCGCG